MEKIELMSGEDFQNLLEDISEQRRELRELVEELREEIVEDFESLSDSEQLLAIKSRSDTEKWVRMRLEEGKKDEPLFGQISDEEIRHLVDLIRENPRYRTTIG